MTQSKNLLRCVPQVSVCADIFAQAFVHLEFVPQGLLGFCGFAAQLSRSEEFEMASLASCQKWRIPHVFKD